MTHAPMIETAPPLFKKVRPERLGLIAGQGNFPLLLAEAARHRGVEVIAFAIKRLASPEIEKNCARVHWLDIGELQRAFDLFHEEKLRHAVMAGRVPHSVIFRLHTLDKRARKLVVSLGTKQADTILGRTVQEFAGEGIDFIDSSYYLQDLLPAEGVLTNHREPTPTELDDIEFGAEIAKSIAGLDIGQTIVVKNQVVVAVEALEGTNSTILRAGEIAGPGAIVIKVSKPQQDRRFDIPVVGLTTIEKMIEAKISLFAMSANETLFFDQPVAIPLAEKNDICLLAI